MRTPKPRSPTKSIKRSKYFGARQDIATAPRRIKAILQALDRAYPNARTALKYRNPFELLIATILSAQSTDETVNRVAPALFERYPTPATLASADSTDVETLVRPTGFFRVKARAIIGCARELQERYGGEVPRTLAELITLPGVARKTANVVLSNCWPRPASDHGIFVDTHVHRVSQRLALTSQDMPNLIELDLMKLVPESKWADFPHQLIFLGRGPCNARNPQHVECPLLRWCPTGQNALHLRPSGPKRPATSVRSKASRARS